MAAIEPASGGAGEWKVERLQPGDAETLCPLQIEAGWNQVAADWRLMLSLGRGYGVRGANGRWIASALSLPLGAEIAWLSMVLVTQPARKRGLGTLLMSRCLAEVEASALAAGLDATELGRPIYLPLGFRDVYPLSRWHVPQAACHVTSPPESITVRSATLDDLERIYAYDLSRSGFARAVILADLLARAPALARLAERADGSLAGYALGRDGYRAWHIGPVVAEDEATGLALLSSALASADRAAIADVPDRHANIRSWLAEQGASAPRGFMRMLRGGDSRLDDCSRVFALAGPELG
jgi:GNAT superfamily N-acetyltransferase